MKANEFIEAFENYHENIYRFVYFKVNKNKQIAEDVTQEVFMKAWEKRDLYDAAKSSLRSWLYMICKRLIIDEYRAKTMPTLEEKHTDLPEKVNKIEEGYMLSFIANKISDLKEQDKEIIILRYIEGFELDEISIIIDKSYDATKVACNRAMRKLQELIGTGELKLQIKS